MNKKTRSEWGSNEDWDKFQCLFEHHEMLIPNRGYVCWIANSSAQGEAETREEARRLAVEIYCDKLLSFAPPLPWLPDYDLSTEEGCEEAIKTCGYDPDWDFGRPKITLYKNTPMNKIAVYDEVKVLPPHLEHWQAAAQWAIDNPVGDK